MRIMYKIGIIGCGSIGRMIVENAGYVDVKIVAIYDDILSRAKDLAPDGCKVAKNFEEFLREDADLVVEAASQEAVREYGRAVLKSGKDLIVMSSGALLDYQLREEMIDASKGHNSNIFIPSGAILGLDNLKILRFMDGDISLRTIKNPKSLGIEDLTGKKVVFKGKASEAVKKFPFNINVAASLSLATGRDIDVEIVADSDVRDNIHQIRAKGEFGKITIDIENSKFPKNPKTSYLAALSILSLLKTRNDQIKIG
jgi:aspartate dehydrogenase